MLGVFLVCILILAKQCQAKFFWHVNLPNLSPEPEALFYLGPNNVTVLCPQAEVGESGLVEGVSYTKRDREGILSLLQDDQNNPELATTSTFTQTVSPWCVEKIPSKPEGFDTGSGFENDASLQPSWGATCNNA
ncbi:hypothetical protein M9434_001339 [Picochlorum sp. BPE23]|nr:hypothetical protein M9434_001339 [Picochlorum sp. BPE23]